MSRALLLCVALSLALSLALGGCSWLGRTAGKAQAKIERKANDIKHGYNDGYSQEKAKTEQTEEQY